MKTFSFHAESMMEAADFLKRILHRVGGTVVTRIEPVHLRDHTGNPIPDVYVEFQSDGWETFFRSQLREMLNGKAILQSLRPCPLSENSLLCKVEVG